MNPEVRYYFSIFLRRLPLFLLIAVSISSSAVAFAVILPTVYTASALLLVERAQIPDQLAQSTVRVQAREQLQIMQQRLMTRANLIDIARQFQVYTDLGVLNPDQIVDRMRTDTAFRSSSGRDQATLLTVVFNGRTAQISAQVANEYVTRILAENARLRMRQAADTLSFFEQQVEQLETELDVKSFQILKFQSENAGALPSNLPIYTQRASVLQDRLSLLNRDLSLLSEQRERLIRVFETTGGIDAPGVPRTPEQQRLAALKSELSQLLAVYSKDSPRVRLVNSQIEVLEDQIAAQAGLATEEDADPNSSATLLDLQLAEVDSRINLSEQQRDAMQGELDDLTDSIREIPNNTIELESLEREYENVQAQYNQSLNRLSTAQTGEQIETLNRGERVTVIEQAIAPTEPSKPNRPLIAAGGTAFGVAAATFLVVMLEILNKAIRRPVDITNGLGITPLATVPYIATRGEKMRRRAAVLLALLFVLSGIPAILYVVHYQFMPLDLLVSKVIDKLRF